jgi:hypothetical protein
MDEIRPWIKANAAPRHGARELMKPLRGVVCEADVDRPALHVETMLSYAGRLTA